jgi:hypothetical protein
MMTPLHIRIFFSDPPPFSLLGPVYMEAGLARLARQPGKRDLAV